MRNFPFSFCFFPFWVSSPFVDSTTIIRTLLLCHSNSFSSLSIFLLFSLLFCLIAYSFCLLAHDPAFIPFNIIALASPGLSGISLHEISLHTESATSSFSTSVGLDSCLALFLIVLTDGYDMKASEKTQVRQSL